MHNKENTSFEENDEDEMRYRIEQLRFEHNTDG